jgi:hypothetical protein
MSDRPTAGASEHDEDEKPQSATDRAFERLQALPLAAKAGLALAVVVVALIVVALTRPDVEDLAGPDEGPAAGQTDDDAPGDDHADADEGEDADEEEGLVGGMDEDELVEALEDGDFYDDGESNPHEAPLPATFSHGIINGFVEGHYTRDTYDSTWDTWDDVRRYVTDDRWDDKQAELDRDRDQYEMADLGWTNEGSTVEAEVLDTAYVGKFDGRYLFSVQYRLVAEFDHQSRPVTSVHDVRLGLVEAGDGMLIDEVHKFGSSTAGQSPEDAAGA